MTRAAIIGCALCLAGCVPTLESAVDVGINDYHATEGNIANEMLLTNILMARDGLPVQFSDVASIHGAFNFTSQLQAQIPWGPINHSNGRGTATPLMSFQSAPYFDVTSLNTQPFTNGVLSPIDPKVIQNFLDLGVDHRLILILFFSEIKIGTSVPISNSPFDFTTVGDKDCSRGAIACTQFFEYLHLIDTMGRFRINIYHELKPIGRPFDLVLQSQLKDVTAIDPTKYVLRPAMEDPNKLQLYEVSAQSKFAICFFDKPNIVGFESRDKPSDTARAEDICSKSEVPLATETEARNHRSTALMKNSADKTVVLTPRSVYGMIKYLGELLRFGDLQKIGGNPRCISLDDPTKPVQDEQRLCESGNIIFTLRRAEQNPAFVVRYNGDNYFVRKFEREKNKCYDNTTEPQKVVACDHTFEVLSMVTLLLDLNKSASDLRSTPTVVVAP